MDKAQLLGTVERLIQAWHDGKLGGEWMPEDENPHYPKGSSENFLYFTLPMALNYQRNSYKLWEAANKTVSDEDTADIFIPPIVSLMKEALLKEKMLKYKLALQPNRHPQIWRKLCQTFNDRFDGDVRNLFICCHNDVKEIKAYILENKGSFPYLSGPKILNYWLYVMGNYTDIKLRNKGYITVAPDTNVIQASLHLGLITKEEYQSHQAQALAAERWETLLKGTDYNPIDIHTPLWLWSRSGFVEIGKK